MAAYNNNSENNKNNAAYNKSSNDFTNCKNTNKNWIPGCTPPQEIFAVATSISILLYQNLSKLEVQTVINLLTMIVDILSSMIDQQLLCEGKTVPPQTITPASSTLDSKEEI